MKDILTGKTQKHLVLDEKSQLFIHKDMVNSLNNLREAAKNAGFDLALASAFRSFDHQLKIWDNKAQGLRPLLDDQGNILDYKSLSAREIIYAILRWSALPGASRHHWGSDIDVYDLSRKPEDYKVQLIPQESEPGGPFYEFHQWLDTSLDEFNFYRPYALDAGGIAPERWHISYAPISTTYQKNLTFDLLEIVITESDIELKEIILQELPEIYSRFIDI